MNSGETFLICLGSNDLATYCSVLQAIATFMSVAVSGHVANMLLGSVTFCALLWDILTSHGDLRRINYGKYVTILFIYSFLFSQTANIRLVEYDPINGSLESGDGKTFDTVQNMPYVPAYLLSAVYELNYNLTVWIDRSFYQSTTMARTGLMDKVAEYSELYGGQIKDAKLSGLLTSYIKNIFIRDVRNDAGSSGYSVLHDNDAKRLLDSMYGLGGGVPLQSSHIMSHSTDDMYVVEDRGSGSYYVLNYDQADAVTSNSTILLTNKGDFYFMLLEELEEYYDSKILDYQKEHPDFFIPNDFKYLKSSVESSKVNPADGRKYNMPGEFRNFVLAMVLNGTSGRMAGMSAADVFTITKTATENAEAAKNNAMLVKMSLIVVIDLGLLLLMIAFPFIFVLSSLPYFFSLAGKYIGAFFILAFAGPGGFAAEKILDSFQVNNLANAIAGSTAGLSGTVQSGVLSLYNMYPWITLVAYGMVGGLIFSFGKGVQMLGNIVARMMPTLERNQAAVLSGNENFGARSYEALSAWNANIMNNAVGSNILYSADMNRAQAMVDFWNRYGIDGKTEKSMLASGAIKMGDDGKSIEVGADPAALAKYAVRQEVYPDQAYKKGVSGESGKNTLDALAGLGKDQGYSAAYNARNSAFHLRHIEELGNNVQDAFIQDLRAFSGLNLSRESSTRVNNQVSQYAGGNFHTGTGGDFKGGNISVGVDTGVRNEKATGLSDGFSEMVNFESKARELCDTIKLSSELYSGRESVDYIMKNIRENIGDDKDKERIFDSIAFKNPGMIMDRGERLVPNSDGQSVIMDYVRHFNPRVQNSRVNNVR